jgi:ppGpp synthetase/RelA/SpoT-type nucleotidyltranferase
MTQETLRFDRTRLLKNANITTEEFARTQLNWSDLEAIYCQHLERYDDLMTTGAYVRERLQQVPAIHSLKLRIKNPEHLVSKIIRKRLKEPERIIDSTNYRREVTDLIGLRALHLFKDEWRPIHEFVTAIWDTHEPPIAYVRRGDPDALQQSFTAAGLGVEPHEQGYRSVHYLLKSKPSKEDHVVELQVRTIFEEGWSEIDHRIRYPRHSDDQFLAEFLQIFNRLAGSADEMGTFIQALSTGLAVLSAKAAERDVMEEKLRETVGQLQMSQEQKASVERQLDALRRPPPSIEPIFSTGLAATGGLSVASLASVIGATGPTLSFLQDQTRNCSRCNKPFTVGSGSVVFGETRCPDCRGKLF